MVPATEAVGPIEFATDFKGARRPKTSRARGLPHSLPPIAGAEGGYRRTTARRLILFHELFHRVIRVPPAPQGHGMKQLALDIGMAAGPTLAGFFAGPNEAALRHLALWVGDARTNAVRSPVPTYLWGEGGCGKTHLLEAVRAALHERGIVAGRLHAGLADPPEFDERWSVVLLDDVHLYTAVQQHTAFNWFVNAQSLQRGVVAAGALPPADLPLREDLRTRLGWGHVFHLQVLSESERRAVLRQAADSRGVILTDDVIDYMLHRFSRDLGSLMELLAQLDGYALQTQRAITIPLIRAMLENE